MQEKQEQPRPLLLWSEAVPISFSECYTAASHNRFRQGAVDTSPNIPKERDTYVRCLSRPGGSILSELYFRDIYLSHSIFYHIAQRILNQVSKCKTPRYSSEYRGVFYLLNAELVSIWCRSATPFTENSAVSRVSGCLLVHAALTDVPSYKISISR